MMLDTLVFHPSTERELGQFARNPSHAVLLVGSEGMGKRTIAEQLASIILDLPGVETLERYPHARVIMPEDGKDVIPIDAVRGLQQFTKLKIAGSQTRPQRIIIVDEAQTMTVEAQNALLKLLEEPPAGTVFVLNVRNVQELLPTVRSRAQHIAIRQPTREQLESYFGAQGFDTNQVSNAYLMSGGLPGLMHALLHDKSDHPLVKAVEQARELLLAKTFERLSAVDSLTKQKTDCSRLLFVLQQMAHAALGTAAGKGASARTLQQWQHVLAATYDAEVAMKGNAQAKLVLTNLMLAL